MHDVERTRLEAGRRETESREADVRPRLGAGGDVSERGGVKPSVKEELNPVEKRKGEVVEAA